MIVVAIFFVGAIATCAAGIFGAALGRLIIGGRPATPRRHWIFLGAAAGCAGGFIGIVGLSVVNIIAGSGVSAVIPVAVVSAAIGGAVSPLLERNRRANTTDEGRSSRGDGHR